MIVSEHGADVLCAGVRDFSLRDTLLCGQCFRWEETEPDVFFGIVGERTLTVLQRGDTLVFQDSTLPEFEAVFRSYFDLGRDYGAIKAALYTDAALKTAIDFAPGLRVLRQPPWEALCSFILSQNNNIKRIKGIVSQLCECFGKPILDNAGNLTAYAFPDADTLARLNEPDLAPLRAGWRAAYLLDAAQKVSSGEIDVAELYTCPIDEARETLRSIKGVGPKVADCVLLYGFARTEAFPLDVWMKRAMQRYYPDGLPACAQQYPGLAQQYLFHYIRCGDKDCTPSVCISSTAK